VAAPATDARPAPLLGARKITRTLFFAAAIVAGALVGVFLTYESDLPQVSQLEDYRPNIITQVFAADGSLVGQFAIERRVPLAFKDIPVVLRNAVVAVEDADFWKHIGVNPWSVPRAAFANLRAGRRREGFSTLTMQLSRLLFLTPEKTYERKIKEIILAFQIEKNFTKEEIFALYCNQIYFGHGNYGVEAASQFFFSKSARDLTLAEAALIAGVGQSPGRLSPVEYPDRALQRRNHVLERMREEKYIAAEEAQAAQAEPLSLRLRREAPSIAPHFVEEVRKYLEREYGSQRIYQGGLSVYTTLDPAMQQAASGAMTQGLRDLDRKIRGFVRPADSVTARGMALPSASLEEWQRPLAPGDVVRGIVLQSDRASALVRIAGYRARVSPAEIAWTGQRRVDEVLPRGAIAPFRLVSLEGQPAAGEAHVLLEQEPEIEGALVAIDVRSGAVRAMVGGYDFERSKFNRASQAFRQTGSAFKPIVYTAAIEKAGWNPATILVDAPISFPNPWTGEIWTPHNYDGAFMGAITLRQAVEQSRNIPAVKTLQHVGVPTGIEYARKLGLTSELPPYLPIAIGAGDATLIEMTTAFATFANQGLRMHPYLIERITDRDGNVIEETRPQATDAIRADTAYLMTSLLRGVVERGTAVRARSLKRPIAGKTGTTNDWTDGWFIGFEPTVAAGVWVGFDDKRTSLGRGRDGAHTALPIWMEFWKEAMQGKPVEDFPVPGNIVFVPVDSLGLPVRAGTLGARMEAFVAGSERAPAEP
jgi:penicillin-binding protein 1A